MQKGDYMNDQERLTEAQMKSASFQVHYNEQLYPTTPTKNVCSFCNKFALNLFRAQCGCNLCSNCIFQVLLQNQIFQCPIHSYKKEAVKQEKSSSVVENSESQEQSQIFSEKSINSQKESEILKKDGKELSFIQEQCNDEIHYKVQLTDIFPIQQYKNDQNCYQATLDNSIMCPFNKYVSRQQSNCNFIASPSPQAYTQQSQHDENCKRTSNSQRIHFSELLYSNVSQYLKRGDLMVIKDKDRIEVKQEKQVIQVNDQIMPIRVQLITSNYISQEFYNEFIYQRQDWSNLELVVFMNPGYEQQIYNQEVQLQIKSTSKQKEVFNFNIDLKQLQNFKIIRFFCQLQCYQDQGLIFTVTNKCDIGDYVLESQQYQQKYVNTLKFNQQIQNYDNISDVIGYGMKVTTLQNVTEFLYQIKKKSDNSQYAIQLIQQHFPSILNTIDDKFYKIQHVQRLYLEIVSNFLKTQYKLSEFEKNTFYCRCQRIKFYWPELNQKTNDIINWINNLKNIQ